jgi:hypothetical protein
MLIEPFQQRKLSKPNQLTIARYPLTDFGVNQIPKQSIFLKSGRPSRKDGLRPEGYLKKILKILIRELPPGVGWCKG